MLIDKLVFQSVLGHQWHSLGGISRYWLYLAAYGVKNSNPGRWIMGQVYVEERPIDDKYFSMKMTLKHPRCGNLFMYTGRFELND